METTRNAQENFGCLDTERTTLQIADTIYRQLGGRRFIAMTGARNLVASGAHRSLIFSIPTSRGINRVQIALADDDTYAMTFYRPARSMRLDAAAVATVEQVYADQLTEVFEHHTGLATKL